MVRSLVRSTVCEANAETNSCEVHGCGSNGTFVGVVNGCQVKKNEIKGCQVMGEVKEVRSRVRRSMVRSRVRSRARTRVTRRSTVWVRMTVRLRSMSRLNSRVKSRISYEIKGEM